MNAFKIGSIFALALGTLLCWGCQRQAARIESEVSELRYPTARAETTVDVYHGVKVSDPYRWLEDAESVETQAWVSKQNSLTSGFLAGVGARRQVKVRLGRLLNYARSSAPYERGGRYFFWKNAGLQDQSVLYVQERLESKPKVVINPNLLSKDGTVAITDTAVSEAGTVLAYAMSRSGSDRQEIRIREIDSGREYDETLRWCRFTQIAWKHDGAGFFYNRFPDPNTVAPEDETNYSRVYRHTVGTGQSQDELIYERPDNKELGFAPFVSDDGKYLVLTVHHGTDTRNRIYYRPMEGGKDFVRLLDEGDARYDFVGNMGSVFYFNTDLEAPQGRIIAVDIANPGREMWRTIVAESADVIDRAVMVNNQLVIAYMQDVHHRLKIYGPNGTFSREIPLPALGTVGELSGRQDDTEMFFSFTSFLFPKTNYRYDFESGELTVFEKPRIRFDPQGYETRQVFYRSKDGARVPMFITHRKGLELDGNNPTLLYGYGGFNISIRPRFSASNVVWLERGGVYAVANLRGGGEYGQRWHGAGMLANKQNVFDDFIAAAQWLIENRYTNAKKLAIRGGSNGGLLVAACMLQRPDLYGAVVCQVPVTDMLRYHKFTVGRYWVPEYGNAESSSEQFAYLYAYSPLHNVKAGVDYPPILITSADTDDRVVPSHAKKFAATLQAKAGGRGPILLRVETKAGHGGGKPISKTIEEQVDIYAFLFRVLDVPGTD